MPKGRPREFDTEQALEAALLLFWRHGYEGTSLAALAAAMDVHMPSLYAAFGNKELLFKRVLQRYLQRPASYLPKALEEPTARGAIEQLFRGAINMVTNRRHPDGCLLVQGALASGPGAEVVQQELIRRRAGAEAAVPAPKPPCDSDYSAPSTKATCRPMRIPPCWPASSSPCCGVCRCKPPAAPPGCSSSKSRSWRCGAGRDQGKSKR